MVHAYIIRLPLDGQIKGDSKIDSSQCDIHRPIDLRRTPISLVTSVLTHKGFFDYRDLLQRDYELQKRVVRCKRLVMDTWSHLWTYAAPLASGKKRRDIERQKISMEAFNVCLGLGLPGASEYDQDIISKLIPEIKKLVDKVKNQLGFYIRKNEGKYKPPTEPVVLQTTSFVVERLIKGDIWYSGHLATTFEVRQDGGPENAILKVFDPVKLNCLPYELEISEERFEYVKTCLNSWFPRNVYCSISECFLREVRACFLIIKRLDNYSDYVPELLSYGFLENKSSRDDSISREELYDPYITDPAGHDVLNQQGGFVLIEHLKAVKDPAKTIEEDERVEIAKECLKALRKIHGAGILHGDIKEDNFIVTKSNTGKHLVKIIDFGLSLIITTTSANDENVQLGEKRGADAMGECVTDPLGDHDAINGFFMKLSKAEMEQ